MGCFTLKTPMFVTYSLVITNIESTVCVYMYMCTLLASCQIKGNFFFCRSALVLSHKGYSFF